ncbi:MAG: DNA alkylation repair protein [Candidatus Thorarchaeota archaeon]
MTIETNVLQSQIIDELSKFASVKYRQAIERYTTAKPLNLEYLGVRIPEIRKIANSFFQKLKVLGIKNIDDIILYCEYLLESRIAELRTIAFQWSFKCKKQFQPKHFIVFERWLKKYVTGWGSTDDFCVKSFGYFIYTFPEFIPKVKKWTNSRNQWVRRASAVVLIYGLRRGEFLEDAFELADLLFNDEEMYVLKGYGWMLKEASNTYKDKVFAYVMKNKEDMPRTSLRYAIEKMPDEMRKKAMAKN